jgi:hypothetical protein
MITFVSFTSTGGRIGRIQWLNTTSADHVGWGRWSWDIYWPALATDTPEWLLKMQKIQRDMNAVIDGFRSLAPTVAQAEKAISAFAEAWRKHS